VEFLFGEIKMKQYLPPGFALKGRKTQTPLLIPFYEELNQAVAEIANTIKKNNGVLYRGEISHRSKRFDD
jgi:hypothetical protein